MPPLPLSSSALARALSKTGLSGASIRTGLSSTSAFGASAFGASAFGASAFGASAFRASRIAASLRASLVRSPLAWSSIPMTVLGAAWLSGAVQGGLAGWESRVALAQAHQAGRAAITARIADSPANPSRSADAGAAISQAGIDAGRQEFLRHAIVAAARHNGVPAPLLVHIASIESGAFQRRPDQSVAGQSEMGQSEAGQSVAGQSEAARKERHAARPAASHPAAPRSTARGPFQILASTWTRVVSDHPEICPTGRCDRNDPVAASEVAAHLVVDDNAFLTERLGHAPNQTESYLAFFLGRDRAVSFLTALNRRPRAHAAHLFSREARANHGIFFTRDGHPRSLAQVYHIMAAKLDLAAAKLDLTPEHTTPPSPSSNSSRPS